MVQVLPGFEFRPGGHPQAEMVEPGAGSELPSVLHGAQVTLVKP